MNFSHLKTIAWLRWRLIRNQFSRVGKTSRIFTIIILVAGLLISIGMFFGAWLASGSFLSDAPAESMLLVWGLVVGGFLFAWSIGVLTDLQKSEPMSLAKFLHLPVSPRGAFLSNFLSSFISFSMIMIFPLMLGLSFGMISHYGLRLAPGVFLLLAFIFLITAVTYQFRGWLAALMVNKRRRRAIITGLTFSMIAVSQLPQLMNMKTFRDADKRGGSISQIALEARGVAQAEFSDGTIDEQTYLARLQEIEFERRANRKQLARDTTAFVRPFLVFLPVAWLPLGMESMAVGGSLSNLLGVPFACFVLMVGLGIMSLQRSYATTLKMYRGELAVEHTTNVSDNSDRQPSWVNRLLEKKLPLLSEQQSAIATSTMATIIRAPEAKMALLTPFAIMIILGISFTYRSPESVPVMFRSFTGIGVITFAMFGIMQLVNNQFGYDRDGFRCMVLSPVRRVDILIGKNMGFLPFAVGIGMIGIVAMQVFLPMQFTHFLATFVQLFSVYLITCTVSNLMSIKAPLAIASGTMKPLNMNLTIIVMQLLITFLLPISLIPVMIPPVIEIFTSNFMGIDQIPVYLLLSFAMLAATLIYYRIAICVQGRMLEESEKQILETVTQVGT